MADEAGAQTPDSVPQEAKYTDAQMQAAVQARVSSERKKLEARDAELADLRQKLSEVAPLQERMKQIEEEKELAGKTAAEKEAARFQRDLDKLRRDAEEKSKTIAERDAHLQKVEATLRGERSSRALMDAMAAAKVIRPEKATKAALLDITIEHTDEGLRATYGDIHEGSVAEAVAAWVKENDHFLPAPPGGSGTRQGGSGNSTKPLHEMADDDLLRLGRRR